MLLVQQGQAAAHGRPLKQPSIEFLFDSLLDKRAFGTNEKPSQAPLGLLPHNQRELDALLKVQPALAWWLLPSLMSCQLRPLPCKCRPGR